jgi:capsular polysaccharide biosynthesis protein
MKASVIVSRLTMFIIGRRDQPRSPELQHETADRQSLIMDSMMFDAGWYCKQLQRELPIKNALDHYIKIGYGKYDPNDLFCTKYYLKNHPFLLEQSLTPLEHYIRYGEAAGDKPSRTFDPTWYLATYEDVKEAGFSALAHYLLHGRHEGRLTASPDIKDIESLKSLLSSLPPCRGRTDVKIILPVCSTEILTGATEGICNEYYINLEDHSAAGLHEIKSLKAKVYRIEKGYLIAGSRYLIVGNYIVCDESADTFYEQGIAEKSQYGVRMLTEGAIKLEVSLRQAKWIQSGIHLMHEYDSNYFHFVAEILPKLKLINDADIDGNVPLLVSDGLDPNIEWLINRCSTPKRKIIRLETGTCYSFQTLYHTTDLTRVYDAYSGGPLQLESFIDVESIYAILKDRSVYSGPENQGQTRSRRLFLSRSSSYRTLVNQSELEKCAISLGFEVIDTGKMTIIEQIQIFQNAEMVISPTGAALANIVWCPKGCQVIVLASDHPSHQLYLWKLLANVSGSRVSTLLGPREGVMEGLYSVHDDFTISLDSFRDILMRLQTQVITCGVPQ